VSGFSRTVRDRAHGKIRRTLRTIAALPPAVTPDEILTQAASLGQPARAEGLNRQHTGTRAASTPDQHSGNERHRTKQDLSFEHGPIDGNGCARTILVVGRDFRAARSGQRFQE
jgi:hypothetical protein